MPRIGLCMATIRIAVPIIMLMAGSTSAQTVLLVSADAADGGDGLTWATAYNRLQDALTAR